MIKPPQPHPLDSWSDPFAISRSPNITLWSRGTHVQNESSPCYPMTGVNKDDWVKCNMGAPKCVPNLKGLAQKILKSEDPLPKQFWTRAGCTASWPRLTSAKYDEGLSKASYSSVRITLVPFLGRQMPFWCSGVPRAKWALTLLSCSGGQ